MSNRKQPRNSPRKSATTAGKARGRRYTPQEKENALRLADRIGVRNAAAQLGMSAWSLYTWRMARDRPPAAKTLSRTDGNGSVPGSVQLPPGTIKKVVAVWKNNQGFGPSQVRNQLRRIGTRVDTKTVRKILSAHGYVPPGKKPPRSGDLRRFEASRPLELVQMDVLHFYVHAQKMYLVVILDDHSRFITGWGLLQRETMEDAIAVFEESIRRYGKPEAVLTDRGAAFHAWSGVSRFDRMLEGFGIDHLLAADTFRGPDCCF